MDDQKEKPRQCLSGLFPLSSSDYNQIYLIEKEEINKLKWKLSEQAGYDIGYQHAEWVWFFSYRDKWLWGIRKSGNL